MLYKIIRRATEPSSYAGVASIALGWSSLSTVDQLALVAAIALEVGNNALSTGRPVLGACAIAAGILCIVIPERGR